MTLTERLRPLARADFLGSAGLYLTRDRLYLVRLRKDLLRVRVVAEETREVTTAKAREPITSLTGWIPEELMEVELGLGSRGERPELREAIRSLLPHLSPVADSIYLSVSLDQGVACRVFLPLAAEQNLAEVVGYEVERLMPFRRDEVYYDYARAGRRGDKVAVLLFGLPKRLVDRVVEALAAFGLKLRGAETSATAVANYFLFSAAGARGPALVVGARGERYELVGVQGAEDRWGRKSEILFAYSVPQHEWALPAVREILASHFGAPPRFFSWADGQELVASIAGGEAAAEVVDLRSAAAERLSWPAGPVDPASIPALGSALRGVREEAFELNLLPAEARSRERRMLSRLNGLLAILLVLGSVAWAASYPIKDELRLRQLRRETLKIAPAVEELKGKETELRALQRQIAFLADVKGRRGEALRVLEERSQTVPPSAYVSSFRLRDATVELQGSAENASALVPLLERSPLFKNVGFNAPSNRGRDNRETFSLKAELELPEKPVKP
jgi:Tfp pilus assembly protein PilN